MSVVSINGALAINEEELSEFVRAEIDLSKLSQKDADLALRAIHWAHAKESAYETEQLIQRKREDDRRASLRTERILAQQMGRKSVP